MLTRLPWHSRQWQLLEGAFAADRLGHALLLTGPRGIGLNRFARQLTASLLCQSPAAAATACGSCRSCVLFSAGTHPDFICVAPESEGKQIKVDMVRDLIASLGLKSQFQGHKVAVISPAEAMNRTAANTLLKTLEEPPGQALLLLPSYRPEQLPITIRSRCQKIPFQADYSQESIAWLSGQANIGAAAGALLNMAHGAPLAALAMLREEQPQKEAEIIADLQALLQQQQDPVRLAEKWNALGASLVLRCLLDLSIAMVRLKSGLASDGRLASDNRFSRLQAMANRLHLHKLMQLHDLVLKNHGLCNSSVSFNKQALLEEVIIHWQYQTRSSGG